MFTNDKLFTIWWLLFGDSTVCKIVNLQAVSKEQKCNWMPIFEYKLLRFQLHFEFDSVWHYRFEKGPIESSLQSKIFGFFLLLFPQNKRKIYLVCLS